MPDEREERFVHRIEAFSDIVIGFSLAQLGATLIVPAHAQSLIENPGWLFGFAWTFALVCLMWWNHNRIFRTTFKPTRISLLLNFLLLATIVLLVYFAQVFARATDVPDAIVAGRFYFAALAISAIETALLYKVNDGSARAIAVQSISGLTQALAVVVCCFTGENPWALPAMGMAVPIGYALGGYVGRRIVPAAVPVA